MSDNIKEVYKLSDNVLLMDSKNNIINRILYNSTYVHRPYFVSCSNSSFGGYFNATEFAEYIASCKLYKIEEILDNKLEFLDTNIVEILEGVGS